jgi:predicted TIM-barrel enzyme
MSYFTAGWCPIILSNLSRTSPAVLGTYWSWAPSFRERWCPVYSGVNICRLRRAHDHFLSRIRSLSSSDCESRPAVRPLVYSGQLFAAFESAGVAKKTRSNPRMVASARGLLTTSTGRTLFAAITFASIWLSSIASGGRNIKRCETTTN